MVGDNTLDDIEKINAQVSAIDVEIANLRRRKKILSDKRAELVSEREFQAKVSRLTAEQKNRIVVKPRPADGVAKAGAK